MSDHIHPTPRNHGPMAFYDKSIFEGAFATGSLEYISAQANEAERMRMTGQTQKWGQWRVIICYQTSVPEGTPLLFHRGHPACVATEWFDRLGNRLTFYAMVRSTTEWIDTPGMLERSATMEVHISPYVRINWDRTTPWPISPATANYLEPHQFSLDEHQPILLRDRPPNLIIFVRYSQEILNLALAEDEQIRNSKCFSHLSETCYLNPTLPPYTDLITGGKLSGSSISTALRSRLLAIDIIPVHSPVVTTEPTVEEVKDIIGDMAFANGGRAWVNKTEDGTPPFPLNPMPTEDGIQKSSVRIWWT